MEPFDSTTDERIRISNSPRRSPLINEGLKSPARSVHPQMQQMASFQTQGTISSNMTDIFESSSDEEDGNVANPIDSAPDVNLLERRGSPAKDRRPESQMETLETRYDSISDPVEPERDGYEKLPASTHVLVENKEVAAESPGTPFTGSVDEMLQDTHGNASQFPRSSHIPTAHTARSSLHMGQVIERQSPMLANRTDTIGAYAIAHEITLQALMRDKEMLDRSLPSNMRGDPSEAFDDSLEPTQPKVRNFSMPPTSVPKRVQMIPAAIDTLSARRSLPANLVRTPYPFSPETTDRKDFSRNTVSVSGCAPEHSRESLLHLSIRLTHANSKTRMTGLSIPASNDFTAVKSSSPGRKEEHFKSMEFDDAELCLQLRRRYRELIGPIRFIGARSLSRITVRHACIKDSDQSGTWSSPQSGTSTSAHHISMDDATEADLWRRYRKPRAGNAQYNLVHWARRIAATSPAQNVQSEAKSDAATHEENEARRLQQSDGLEFVMGWSAARILLALAVVLVLSVAATVLWVFLGKSSPGGADHSDGFRNAGERVTSGVLMGICVLLLGLSSIAGWMGASWLLM